MSMENEPQQCIYLEVQNESGTSFVRFLELIQMNCSLISYNVVVKWHIRTQTDKQRNTHQTKTDKTKYKARPKNTGQKHKQAQQIPNTKARVSI